MENNKKSKLNFYQGHKNTTQGVKAELVRVMQTNNLGEVKFAISYQNPAQISAMREKYGDISIKGYAETTHEGNAYMVTSKSYDRIDALIVAYSDDELPENVLTRLIQQDQMQLSVNEKLILNGKINEQARKYFTTRIASAMAQNQAHEQSL